MVSQQPTVEQLFAGNSEMARLMRSHDWSQTSLGAPEQWSQSLKTAVRIMLTSRQPMFVWWGEELINLYNDAYRAIVGGKHPQALGQPASVVWQEIWDQVEPRAESALLNNEGTYDEALLLIMERNGYPEETYYTFSYSPIPDDEGGTSGIICANTDDTQRIIGERQLALLRELAARTADARTFEEACTLSASCLETNLYDLPFAIIYLVEPDQQHVVLAGTSGIDRNHPAIPEVAKLDGGSGWSFTEVIQTQKPVLISDLVPQFGELPRGAWDRLPEQAIVVPIAPSGQTGRAGILVAGLNPFRLFDDNYRSFIDLVAGQIAASVANANAYEKERKRAETLTELDRAKTVFFSNISHEFRTPLTLMLSPLEELSNTLEERLSGDEREQFQMVQRNGLRLQKLVNTLLDFSRLEAGRVQASYQPTNLAGYTAELASVFRSLIERAGMSLIIDCSTLPEPVYIDHEMWEKIVLNLISNAFKFTFAGSITVRLRSLGKLVEFSVTDTGVGIPEAELPRLFERFHRVEGTRSRTYEGSGIGLALVQELVKLHGGTIRVTSQLEQGTTFAIALPLGSDHLPQDRIEATRSLTSTALGSDPYVIEASRWLPEAGNGEWGAENGNIISSSPIPYSTHPTPGTARILLVDDNADMRDYLQRTLNQYWEVEVASNGLEALESTAQRLPDLVLSDVMMPELDGFGLLHALRTNSRTREISIILLSARAGEESRIEGLAAGADDYLTKPFSVRELLARVKANLKLTQLRREAAQREQALRLEAETARQTVESILTSIRDGFYTLDRDWRYTYANDRFCEMVGMEREALWGQCVWELFADAVGTDVYVQFQQAVNQQTPLQFEYLYATWNRWYEYRIYPSSTGLTAFIIEITDRKQTDIALQAATLETQQRAHEAEKAQRMLHLLLENVPEGISIAGGPPDFPIIAHSKLAQEWLGKSGESLIKMPSEIQMPNDYQVPSYELFLPDGVTRPTLEQMPMYRATRHGATVSNEEWVIERPDGIRLTVLVHVAPIRNSQEQIIGAINCWRDITERKRFEETLRQLVECAKLKGAEFFADLVRVLAEALQVRYAFVSEVEPKNRKYAKTLAMWGDSDWSETCEYELVGTPCQEVADQGLCFYRDQVATMFPQDPLLAQMGVNSYLGIPLRALDGSILGMLAVMHDRPIDERLQPETLIQLFAGQAAAEIERQQAEAALRESMAILNAVNQATPTLIYVKDQQGRLLMANPATLRVIGQPESSVIGKTERDYLRWEDAEPIIENDHRVMTTGQVEVFEEIIRLPEGTQTFLSTKSPYRDDQGNIIGLIGISTDITDRKQAELEREHLLARAEAAREEAQSANRIKDEFLAVLSHELRSPLNPILGWANLLRRGNLDPAKTAYALETIERNAQLQTQLIADLLDVSRILQGKMSLHIAPTNLATTIEAAMETVRLAAESKGIDLRFEIAGMGDQKHRLPSSPQPPSPPPPLLSSPIQVMGDSARLQQIVWNLLTNAIKFTPTEGQVEVKLEAVTDSRPSVMGGVTDHAPLCHYAQITVSDTGQGIRSEFLPHVFEYFRQEDGKTTRRFGGLGLGLAIVRYLVEQHGGTVKAESAGEGSGATFTVRLPLLSANREPVGREEPELFMSPLPLPLDDVQILIVDDEADIRDLVAFVLEQAGATVRLATSATEALNLMSQSLPDVLLCDIGMPDTDGYTLISQIRALPSAQGGCVRAIALTAYAGESDYQQAMAAGFQMHLSKPVEPARLVEAIASLMQGS